MNAFLRHSDNLIVASIGLILGGSLWGLMWWPVRAILEVGLWGSWTSAMIYGCTAVLMIPLAVMRWRRIRSRWRHLAVIGLLTGTAFNFFTTSLELTEVIRAILLFYLMPVWGTLMGILFLGERVTAGRGLAILLGIGGLLIMMGLGNGWPWPRNLGDWMALMAGFLWACGSLRLYQMGNVAVSDQMLAFVTGGLIVTVAILVFGGPKLGGPLPMDIFLSALPYGFLLALWFLPTLFLTVWPVTLLTPGRAGLLLMSEVVVGVVSAALFAGETFGMREFIGTLMIVGAAIVELLWRAPSADEQISGTTGH